MSFPEIYKARTDVGTYIPDERVDNVVNKIKTRIDKIMADERKGLTAVVPESENYTFTVSLVRRLNITVPVGTTTKELLKINKVIKKEVMVVEVAIPLPVLNSAVEYPGDNVPEAFYFWTFQGYGTAMPYAQTFIAQSSGILSKFDIYWGGGAAYGTIVMKVMGVDENGFPIGEPLDTISVTKEEGFGDGWQTFEFNGDAHLVEGTKYAIVFDESGLHSIQMAQCGKTSDTEDPLVGGEFLIFNYGVWTTIKNADPIDVTGIPAYGTPEGCRLSGNSELNYSKEFNYHDLCMKTYIIAD